MSGAGFKEVSDQASKIAFNPHLVKATLSWPRVRQSIALNTTVRYLMARQDGVEFAQYGRLPDTDCPRNGENCNRSRHCSQSVDEFCNRWRETHTWLHSFLKTRPSRFSIVLILCESSSFSLLIRLIFSLQ